MFAAKAVAHAPHQHCDIGTLAPAVGVKLVEDEEIEPIGIRNDSGSLEANRRVSIELANLYLGARATIEIEGGAIVAETVESGTPLEPRPPGQKFEGLLPAGTYYLHVAFAGVGGPGTPYAIALTAK